MCIEEQKHVFAFLRTCDWMRLLITLAAVLSSPTSITDTAICNTDGTDRKT